MDVEGCFILTTIKSPPRLSSNYFSLFSFNSKLRKSRLHLIFAALMQSWTNWFCYYFTYIALSAAITKSFSPSKSQWAFSALHLRDFLMYLNCWSLCPSQRVSLPWWFAFIFNSLCSPIHDSSSYISCPKFKWCSPGGLFLTLCSICWH